MDAELTDDELLARTIACRGANGCVRGTDLDETTKDWLRGLYADLRTTERERRAALTDEERAAEDAAAAERERRHQAAAAERARQEAARARRRARWAFWLRFRRPGPRTTAAAAAEGESSVRP